MHYFAPFGVQLKIVATIQKTTKYLTKVTNELQLLATTDPSFKLSTLFPRLCYHFAYILLRILHIFWHLVVILIDTSFSAMLVASLRFSLSHLRESIPPCNISIVHTYSLFYVQHKCIVYHLYHSILFN